MDQKGFWSLIDAVNKEVSPEDTEGILKATQEKLLQLPLREIMDFHNLLTLYMDLADIPDLVAAATIINDGISDDGFTDFRAWLVSRGRDVYAKALKDADSLAKLNVKPEATEFELYGYIGAYAYSVKCLQEKKDLQKLQDNPYFTLKDKGVELVEHMLKNYCVQDEFLMETKDPVIQSLYRMVYQRLRAYDIYEDARKHPLSGKRREEIRGELDIRPSMEWKRSWASAELQDILPDLYEKYQEQSYTMEV